LRVLIHFPAQALAANGPPPAGISIAGAFVTLLKILMEMYIGDHVPMKLTATMNTSEPDVGEEHDPLAILGKLRIIIRTAQRHSAAIQKQCGVSGAQLWILQELRDAPGMKVGELAGRLAIHQTTTSNLLDALEKRGYVAKARDEVDQRVVRLSLTASGAKVLRKAPQPARGLLAEALARVDAPHRAQLDAGLQAVLDVIGEADSAAGSQPLPFML
jgi:DNA-binding MarR family transcriptional regulator